MNYYIKIGEEVVFRSVELKDALRTLSEICRKGHTDVYLHGGRIGKWWNE